METRNDIHSPSKIIPSDYEYVAQEFIKSEGLGDCLFIKAMRERIQKHMATTGGTYSNHVHGGNCSVCGSVNALYTVLFYHRPTNTYIRTGQDCAAKIDASADAEGNLFRRNVIAGREAVAGKRKALATLTDLGLAECYAIYADAFTTTVPQKNQETIITNIVEKLVRYGSISENQIKFVRNLLTQIAERPRIEAERAAQHAAAKDCPIGRVTITGKIASIKTVESFYGTQEKMLVISDDGFKVYGTMPGSLAAGKGDRIEFVATVEQSKDDSKFGFFKRPSKSQVLEAAAA